MPSVLLSVKGQKTIVVEKTFCVSEFSKRNSVMQWHFKMLFRKSYLRSLAGDVEYTNCISADG